MSRNFVRLFAAACLLPVLGVMQDAAGQAPKRKPGLWQQSVSGSGMPTQTMSMCIDEKTDDLMASRANQSQNCEQQSLRREGTSYVFESVCRSQGTTVRTRGRFTGEFNTRYAGELHSTFEPPLQGMRESTQNIEARWIGPCKPGQKPGDVAMEGMEGMGGMNVQDMMNADPKKMKEMMQQMQRMQQQTPQNAPR